MENSAGHLSWTSATIGCPSTTSLCLSENVSSIYCDQCHVFFFLNSINQSNSFLLKSRIIMVLWVTPLHIWASLV